MRIAIITTYAHKIHTARKELLSDLIEEGYHVTIMGPEREGLSIPQLNNKDINYVQINIERVNLNPIKELFYLNNIRKQLENQKINCVLVYGIRMISSIVLAAKLAKIKRIVCVVNGAGNLLMASGVKGKLVQSISFPVLKLALSIADTVIFQNTDDYEELKRKRLVTGRNVNFTKGSGVNTELYNKAPLPSNLEFLLVTRITGSKGVNEYVKAARIVKKKCPNTIFNLVGPKDDHKDEDVDWNAIDSAIAEKAIQYHGETDDVLNFLKNCRVYVFPSYYREGIPRSILEALSVGRPIITTDSPGCKETVIDGVNGYLVPPKDVDFLVEKIVWMIEHPENVNKMALESRKIAIEKFDVNKINQIILNQLLVKEKQ